MAFHARYLATADQVINAATLAAPHGENLKEVFLWQNMALQAPLMVQALLSETVPPTYSAALGAIPVELVVSGAIHNDTLRFEVTMQRVSATTALEIAKSLAVTPDMKYPNPA